MSDASAAVSAHRGIRGSHDERRLTTHWTASKPAPKVATAAPLAPEMIYRVVMDLEALQDAFAERIEDLDVSLTEIDSVTGMTRGNAQKLLSKSDAKWAREFGWKSLGKMLRGTGLKLVLIVDDDERFAPVLAQMTRRSAKKRKQP
jgi:hypothetical protein